MTFVRQIFRYSTKPSPLSIAIVGSGPSGMYCAKYLLKKHSECVVSIFDELPTPFGLVRYGVAPDHQSTKNVINDFQDNVLNNDRVNYYGNVNVGRDISLNDLRNNFNSIILAYGAS